VNYLGDTGLEPVTPCMSSKSRTCIRHIWPDLRLLLTKISKIHHILHIRHLILAYFWCTCKDLWSQGLLWDRHT